MEIFGQFIERTSMASSSTCQHPERSILQSDSFASSEKMSNFSE
jgi:hypothetical protein